MKFYTILLSLAAMAGLAFGQNDFKRRTADEGLPGLNVLRLAAAMADTETVTVNGVVWEASYDGTVTAGRIEIDLSADGTKAVGTLTLTENAADTNTVTIGSTVYTFQTTLTNVAGNVKIGASASVSIDNLIAAINGAAGGGTTYAALTTAHPSGTAAVGAGDTMTFTATVTGTGGNAIDSTDTLAGTSAWGAVTLESGANPSAEEGTDAFVAATNAAVNSPVNAIKIGANEVLCHTRALNKAYASTETLAGSNNVWAAATFYGGSPGRVTDNPVTTVSRLATATEVTLQTMSFVFAFSPANAIIQIRDTTGTIKVSDGAMTISGRRVTWASSGSTDIDADDIVAIIAW